MWATKLYLKRQRKVGDQKRKIKDYEKAKLNQIQLAENTLYGCESPFLRFPSKSQQSSSYRFSGRLKLESFYDCLNLKLWPKKTQNASKRFIETNKHPRKRLNDINDRDDLLLDLGSQSLSYACARYSRITNV